MDSSGAVTSTNTFEASGLVSRRSGTTSIFYSFDSEGNVAQRSDMAGTVLSNHLFSAHGGVLTGSLSDPFGYKAQVGYYTDSETGLQLLTYRYYDPSAGRFLTRDPISYQGGANLYAYVMNNPTNAKDPTGLKNWYAVDQPDDPDRPIQGQSWPDSGFRTPDFFSLQLNAGPMFSWSGQIELDRYGNIYYQPLGYGIGKSATILSCSLTAGWINQDGRPSEKKIGDVLSDQSINGGGGYGVGVSFSGNRAGSTTQIGGMTPQVGASWGYAAKGPNVGVKW